METGERTRSDTTRRDFLATVHQFESELEIETSTIQEGTHFQVSSAKFPEHAALKSRPHRNDYLKFKKVPKLISTSATAIKLRGNGNGAFEVRTFLSQDLRMNFNLFLMMHV